MANETVPHYRAARGTSNEANVNIARRLQTGAALTIQDVTNIFERFGLSPNSITGFTGAALGGAFEARTGVRVEAQQYRGRTIFTDPDHALPGAIDEAKRQIDEAKSEKTAQ